MKILAIESSCDETAVAVVEDGRRVLSSVIRSQAEEHALYGGVVPEIASRRHCESMGELVQRALTEAGCDFSLLDALAVTFAPGLVGALLVGVNYAKGLSFALGRPLIPVHHLRAHLAANYLTHPQLKPPYIGLILSGGHSHILHVQDYTRFTLLAQTRDDAAGEAYDKAARRMGYPYPGGVYIDRAAQSGDPTRYRLPRPRVEEAPGDFSFSGLKTAVIHQMERASRRGEAVCKEDLSASFQLAVCDMVVDRLERAMAPLEGLPVVVAGGVSANRGLRERLEKEAQRWGRTLYFPALFLCGDNAAMVGAQAYYEYQAGHIAAPQLNGLASWPMERECEDLL